MAWERELVVWMQNAYATSLTRACWLTQISRSLNAYRWSLVLEVAQSMSAMSAAKALDRAIARRGVTLDLIRPGSPTEHGFIKAFKGKLPDGCLNVSLLSAAQLAAQPGALRVSATVRH